MQTIGDMIRDARKEHGLSQKGLAEMVRISQPAVCKAETGKSRQSKHLYALFRALNLDVKILDKFVKTGNSPDNLGVAQKRRMRTIGNKDLFGAEDLPVHAQTQGGSGALVISSDPIQYITRPAPLIGVPDGYGILVSENSMSPECGAGDIALVRPHPPWKPGITCVFYAEHGGTVESVIKFLRGETPTEWLVKQFNPPAGEPENYSLPKSKWNKVHVVVGTFKAGFW